MKKIIKKINQLNPIYLKELRIAVRSKKAPIILLLYNGLLALFGLFFFYVTFDAGSRYTGRINYSDILSIYTMIVSVEFALVLFTVPGLTAGSISGEREKQTLDILLTTTLTPMEIIMGKLGSSINAIIMLAVSSLPILGLVFSIGGVTLLDFAKFLVLIIVAAIFIGSIGIFFSTLYKKTTAATVTSYGAVFALTAGTMIIVLAISEIANLNINNQIMGDGLYSNADIGYWLLILLINPGATCYSMLQEQIGTGYELGRFISEFGTLPDFILNNWFEISIVVQLVISLIIIVWTAWLLDPLKGVRKVKKREKNPK